MSAIGEAFQAHVVWGRLKSGHYRARCRKGLWSVEGPDAAAVMTEALHYFRQYYADGEYDDDATGRAPHQGDGE